VHLSSTIIGLIDLAEVVHRGEIHDLTVPVSGSTSTSQMWLPAGKVKWPDRRSVLVQAGLQLVER